MSLLASHRGWRQLIVLLSASFCLAFAAAGYPNVAIVILSQDNSYHRNLAFNLKQDVLDQAAALGVSLGVHVLPDEGSHIGYWTVAPELPRFLQLYGSNPSWIYFCEESTVINLERLLANLRQLNASHKLWLGFGLSDEEPSIIHHFAFAENPSQFKYPLFSAGFAITTALIREVLKTKDGCNEERDSFSIDASHELALWIGTRHPLLHRPTWFCESKGKDCASYPAKIKLCDPSLNIEEIYFAVKTCHKFHQNRIPVVKKTWGRFAKNIEFFSDLKNHSIPTTEVGIANTEQGHCMKTLRILELALAEVTLNLQHVKWVVLVDDDTILSVERLQSLLSCYSPDTVVGERYGYRVRGGRGYNYLTGGGGIAFGVDILASLVSLCHCPQIDSPDDMVLGMCMAAHGVSMVHSSLLHQARPMDYAPSYLGIGLPVSFHKHWNLDPLSVYTKWFSQASSSSFDSLHTEL